MTTSTLERPTKCGSTTYPIWVNCDSCTDPDCAEYHMCLNPSASISAFSTCSTCDKPNMCTEEGNCLGHGITASAEPDLTTDECTEGDLPEGTYDDDAFEISEDEESEDLVERG